MITLDFEAHDRQVIDDLENRIAALEAQLAEMVKVKPLEWHKSEIIGWNGDWHTVPTAYSIRCADENGWKWSGFGGFGYERSDESAKAAAQADYERRILSALEATPPATHANSASVEATPPAPKVTEDDLSEWGGWDMSRYPWSAAHHQDDVCEALFRGPRSMEDAAALIGFINRTWGKSAGTDALTAAQESGQ